MQLNAMAGHCEITIRGPAMPMSPAWGARAGGVLWVPMVIMSLLLLAAVVTAVLLLTTSRRRAPGGAGRGGDQASLNSRDNPPAREATGDPMAQLREQYARGEIDHDELDRHLEDLLGSTREDSDTVRQRERTSRRPR